MDHLLSLSQAARMVGVPRKVLQQHIQAGGLATFEGYLRTSELLKIFPEAAPKDSGMVEKVRRIREAALGKALNDGKPDPERLASELHRMKIYVGQLEDQLEAYKQLSQQMTTRLHHVQEHCDRKQAMLLNTVLGWYMNQVKLRDEDL